MADQHRLDGTPVAGENELMTPAAASPTTSAPRWLKLIDRLSLASAAVGAILLGGMVCTVVADVIRRNAFNRPVPGALELTQFAYMPTLISLGLGYALLRNEHIRVTLLTAPTGPKVQRVIEVLGMVLTIGAMGALAWFGAQRAQTAQLVDEHAVGVEWFAIWPYRWVAVVGMVVLGLQAIAQLVRAIVAPELIPTEDDEMAALADEEPLLAEIDDQIHVAPEVDERIHVAPEVRAR
jgi:TRAP-type C4-dicarboxylate transport system permease small subunit